MREDPSAARTARGSQKVAKRLENFWPRVLVGMGFLKVLIGIIAGGVLLFWLEEPFLTRAPFLLGATVAFTCGALILLPSGRTNPAARYLGIVLLLAATSYAEAAITWAASSIAFLSFLAVISYLQLNAFSPYFLWRFADVFPQETPLGRAARVVRFFTRTSLLVAVILFTSNLLIAVGPLVPALGESGPLGLLKREPKDTYYWAAIFLLTLPALGFLLWKAFRAENPERTRSLAFMAALLLGAGPLLLVTIGQAFSESVRSLFDHPTSAFYTLLIMDAAVLTIPFATGYAVLRHKVIDVRLVIRKAIQYSLAKYVLIIVTLLPIAGLLTFLYTRRDQTVAQLISGPGSVSLGGLSVAAMVALRFRRTWLERLDRRFFREIYELRQVLADFAELTRNAKSTRDLAVAVAKAVNNALHLDRIAVLFQDPLGGAYLTPEGVTTTLPVAALSDVPEAIGHLLAESTEPLTYSPEGDQGRLASVPPNDLNWLSDSGYRLLVPLHTPQGVFAGAICLGEKRSDIPFTQEDRELLHAVAERCSEALESRFLGSKAELGHETEAAGWIYDESATGTVDSQGTTLKLAKAPPIALECTSCRRIAQSQALSCRSCGGRLKRLEIPLIVNGKFELIERIGRGGMGVVYRGLDLMLGRQVALKTLPRLSRSLSSRLRREARAIARVQHPNLATIHGAETWRHIPILVLEYLPGGTLRDRIAHEPLEPFEAAGVLSKIADALAAIHAAGLLHRDVKPSNVGFREGEPQLMDFGLAKLLLDDTPVVGAETALLKPTTSQSTRTAEATRGVVGTPLYMSPEALSGSPPDFDFDTWSTCVTFFEALTGVHPFRDHDEMTTRRRILAVNPRLLEEFDKEYPAVLHHFFEQAFSRRRSRRPTTAAALRDQLVELQTVLSQPV